MLRAFGNKLQKLQIFLHLKYTYNTLFVIVCFFSTAEQKNKTDMDKEKLSIKQRKKDKEKRGKHKRE